MIRRLLNLIASDEALRSIGRVHYRRYDGIGVLTDQRLDPGKIAVIDVPVHANDFVPQGKLMSLANPGDGRRIFAHPADVERIFGGSFPWRDAPWGTR